MASSSQFSSYCCGEEIRGETDTSSSRSTVASAVARKLEGEKDLDLKVQKDQLIF